MPALLIRISRPESPRASDTLAAQAFTDSSLVMSQTVRLTRPSEASFKSWTSDEGHLARAFFIVIGRIRQFKRHAVAGFSGRDGTGGRAGSRSVMFFLGSRAVNIHSDLPPDSA